MRGGQAVARRKPAAAARQRTTHRVATRPRQAAGPAFQSGATQSAADCEPADEGTTPPNAAEPEALVVTRWFDARSDGEPYSATVRFTGRRVGTTGKAQPGDNFVQEETIDGIVPGSGSVSLTAWVYGLRPGEWSVSADVLDRGHEAAGQRRSHRQRPLDTNSLQAGSWSWRRWAVSAGPASPLQTRWALLAPLATSPAVLPGIYPALAVVGAVVALALQAAILPHEHVPVGRSLVVSLVALMVGLVGAKLWYAVLHPRESVIKGGWAVDGFLIVAPLVAAVAMLAFNLPIGTVLDATAPGLFFAVAIGRLGCFFTGCCAGRCTNSRWGVWSSDRRVGARRVPTQLLESGAGLAIGLVALVLVLADVVPVRGLVFVAAFGIYAIVRQSLLRLRAEQRASARTLPLTAAAAVVVLLVIAGLSVVQAG